MRPGGRAGACAAQYPGTDSVAHKSLRQKASKKGRQLQPQTWGFEEHVIVFTTLPEAACSAAQVLHWFRTRRQVELAM